MPRLPNIVTIGDHHQHAWKAALHSGSADAALQTQWLVHIPGARPMGSLLTEVPADAIEQALRIAESLGVDQMQDRRGVPKRAFESHRSSLAKKLRPYQTRTALDLLYHGRLLVNYEMGLGKSATAIAALRSGSFRNSILIVCPAMVRLSWKDELDKWWPKHPEVHVVDEGKKADLDAPITIASYALLRSLRRKSWDAIIPDELHYSQNFQAIRSEELRKLVQGSPKALVGGLTATPITAQFQSIHNQTDILWPGRLGSAGDFKAYFGRFEDSEYAYSGKKLAGLDPKRASLLAERLSFFCHRKTKADPDVAPFLPPFIVTPLRVRAKRSFDVRSLTNDLLRMDRHNAKSVERVVQAFGASKTQEAAQWATTTAKSGERVCVLTNYKATAKAVASQCGRKGIPVLYFDGETTAKKRHAILAQALKMPACVLVCTMHSVKEGINSMAGFDQALIAELYPAHNIMQQVLGRFHRLSGSCAVTIMCVEGSWEELTAERLQRSMKEASMLQTGALTASKLAESLDSAVAESEEETWAALRSMAAERLEYDEYL